MLAQGLEEHRPESNADFAWQTHRLKCWASVLAIHTQPKEVEIAALCNTTMEFLGIHEQPFTPNDISVNYDYVGEGYGAVTDAAIEAIHMAAELEGLILCHTYAGKAFAGMVDLIRSGRFDT